MTVEPRENVLAKEVVDAAFVVHRDLGPGLLESAYQKVLAYELQSRGLRVAAEVPIDLRYRGLVLSAAYIADIIVDDTLLIELKSVEKLAPVHFKQVLTYLRLSGLRLGLLINFGEAVIRGGIHRVANGMP
jgi:GxxExxY protein